MKKIFLVLAALATMAAVSCVKDELNPDALVKPEPPVEKPEEKPVEPPTPEKTAKVVINELCGNKVEYSTFTAANKFIELYNAGDAEADLSGWQMFKNNDAEAVWTAPAGTKLAAGAYLVLEADQADAAVGFNAGFSAKKEVKIELKDASGKSVDVFLRGADATPMAEESLAENKDASFSRVPNGTGDFAYAAPTPGAANGEKTGDIEGYTPAGSEQPAPEKAAKVVINELCGNKVEYSTFTSANKFIELYNAGDAEADLSGWQMFKNNETEAVWTAPAGTKLAAGAYLVLEADQADAAIGFNAGFSAKKEVKIELKDASGKSVDVFLRGADATPMAEESLAENKEASFSRVPNGTGDFAYAAPTPGAANGEKTGDIEGYTK